MTRWTAVLALSVACGPAGPSDSFEPTTVLPEGCNDGAPVDAYVFGLERRSTNDTFTLRLTDAVPAPPDVGDNLLGFEVEGPNGPVTDGTISYRPFMPLHGHGTSPETYDAQVESGAWVVGPMDLFMPGLWELTVTVDADGASDEALFRFCLLG